MNQEPGSFRPVSAVQDILDAFQEQGMGWIADEVADHLHDGQSLPEDNTRFGTKARGATSSYTTVPFSSDDQMRLVLTTIIRYTVEVFDVWNAAVEGLREVLELPNLQVEVTLPESDETLPMFSHEYRHQVEEILEWARMRWPDGPENFDNTLADLRGVHS